RQWVVNITDDPATGRIHLFSAPSLILDAVSKPVLLDASADPAVLDAIAFSKWLEDFVDHVAGWASLLAQDTGSTPDQYEDPLGPAFPSCPSLPSWPLRPH